MVNLYTLPYYMGLQYTIITDEKDGMFISYIKEFGRDVNGVGETKEQSIKDCLDCKQEWISTLLKHNMPVPEPERSNIEPIQLQDSKVIYNNQIPNPKETELVELFNKLFSIKKIKYTDFNSIIPFDKKIIKLRELEKSNQNLHLANLDTDDEGISTLSIIATITKILYGKILAFNVEGDDKNNWVITGVKFLDENE